MLGVKSADSLYGRIVQRYFGFGLACIILLLGATVLTTWYKVDNYKWLVPMACLVPLAVLWAGGFELRRLLAAPEQILTQLANLSTTADLNSRPLVPVTEAEPIAAGWNHLLQHIYSGGLTSDMARKLTTALKSGNKSHGPQILDSLSDGVAVTDSSGAICTSNPSFRALLSVPEDSEDTFNVFELLTRMVSTGILPAELSTGRVSRLRVELCRSEVAADGVYRVSCVPMRDGTESLDSFVWTIRDITQSKLAESMRTEFVQTATHELRTPLANIRAYAETLELADDIPVEQQKEFINVINAESTRLSRFVDELLNLSQMDAGSITISRHETHFDRLLQESIENARPQIDKKRQTLETQIPAKLPSLNIDKDKIAACLVNLLGNASKYSPEEAQIRIVVEESSTQLSIRIEDTGYGIATEELPRVFNRFFRSLDDRIREESGSGLGLAYTQDIARLHGGQLTVESELNKGSQFTLQLPL